jgi:hypothetical protein
MLVQGSTATASWAKRPIDGIGVAGRNRLAQAGTSNT